MNQLAFDLPHRPSHAGEDFLVADCNSNAVAMIDCWPDWPYHVLLLIGPEASGKTHLAHVWQAKSGAVFLDDSEASCSPLVIVEDCDRSRNEELLFHLLNRVKNDNGFVLITARSAPARWNISLKDLESRLLAAPLVEIGAPDDALLGAVMAKMFSDRQVGFDAPLIPYLLKRIDRSFASAREIVGRLDRASLAKRRNITVPLASDLLKNPS